MPSAQFPRASAEVQDRGDLKPALAAASIYETPGTQGCPSRLKVSTFKLLLVLVARLLHQPQLALPVGVLLPHLLLNLLRVATQDTQA